MSRAGDARAERGATLMEALVVVALTAMAATILFPRLERSFASVSLHESTTMFAADLRTVRSLAMRGGVPVVFGVAEDGHTYGWSGGASRITPLSTSVAPASTAVTFYVDGSSSGGTFTLVAGDRRAAVNVDPATGAVAVGTR